MASPGRDRPLSIVVWGNSVAALQGGPRPSHDAGCFGEVMRDRLVDHGLATELYVSARWFDFLVRARRRYETEIRSQVPDVIVMNFGINELQPWLVPVWLLRHLMTEWDAATPLSRMYRRRIAAPAWRQVRSFRRWAAPRVQYTWQTTPARFEHTLHRVLEVALHELHPLILVVDIPTPGEKLEYFLPGVTARHARYQAVLASAVASVASSDARLVAASCIVAEQPEALAPDGMHLTALGHALLGERLANEVTEWHSASTAGG